MFDNQSLCFIPTDSHIKTLKKSLKTKTLKGFKVEWDFILNIELFTLKPVFYRAQLCLQLLIILFIDESFGFDYKSPVLSN